MDLTLTPEQEVFRNDVRMWLKDNVPSEPLPRPSTAQGFEEHRKWERRLYDAGYAAIHWPTEYGGQSASLIDQALFQEQYFASGAPERVSVNGIGVVGPAILEFGTDQQKKRWLPSILSGDDIWCQGFSEPEAGSDLAAIQTKAIRDGDIYRVSGRKIWTTMGPFGDWLFAVCRSDAGAVGHRGLTFLMIDMRSERVRVDPIRQLHGDPGFAEILLEDVVVPVDNAIGEEGAGWEVAMATLGYERGTGLGGHALFRKDIENVIVLARAVGLADDPVVRFRIAQMSADVNAYRHHMYRTLTEMEAGSFSAFQGSVNKVFWSEMQIRILELGIELLGALGHLSVESPLIEEILDKDSKKVWGNWHHRYWYARAATIASGTSEIQRNIIAERLLGLPRGPRVRVRAS